ncbi:hypothetical protein TWF481_010351 [Arthrobotrys musiformis]|uniref:Uncharacterized protein n=1 Tax=Arthrobotrys musiformis TaxID=47236 RepID=A0AAV9W0I1_9PEZI
MSQVISQLPSDSTLQDASGLEKPDNKVFIDDQRECGRQLLSSKVIEVLFKLALSLCSIIFIVLPPLAYSLDGKEVAKNEFGKRVLEWIKWVSAMLRPPSRYNTCINPLNSKGPTIFPIIFAAIVGQLLQAVALKYAQNGAKLGTLEQLTRTTTISSAVIVPYFIQAYNWLSLVLILLWTISPLGGQASLRLLSTRFVQVRSPKEVRFLNPANTTSYLVGGSETGVLLLDTKSIFSASLLSTVGEEHRPTDIWDNVRIPFLEELEQTSQSTDGWFDVAANTTFSSLIGVPIRGLAGNITATIQAGYSRLNCSSLELFDPVNCSNNIPKGRCFSTVDPQSQEWRFPVAEHNSTTRGAIVVALNRTESTFYPGLSNSTDPMHLLFQSQGEKGVSVARCTLFQTYLDVEISCVSSKCAAAKLRRFDTGVHRPPLFYQTVESSLTDFALNFGQLTEVPTRGSTSGASQIYVHDPNKYTSMLRDWVDLVDVGIKNFEIRMAQLLNTYSLIIQGPAVFVSNADLDGSGRELYDLAKDIASRSSIGESTISREEFMCNQVWAAVALFAAVLLFVIGITGAIITFYTLAPNALTSFSALVSESRYFDVIHEGTTLGGDERAVILKNRVVRLGDVEGSSEIGYIALGSIDTEKVGVTELKSDRTYK